nr:MAG TPA: hypothetical protein [Caudoviricetes sp.]
MFLHGFLKCCRSQKIVPDLGKYDWISARTYGCMYMTKEQPLRKGQQP